MHVDGLEDLLEVCVLSRARLEVLQQLGAGLGPDVEVPHLLSHVQDPVQEGSFRAGRHRIHPVHARHWLGPCVLPAQARSSSRSSFCVAYWLLHIVHGHARLPTPPPLRASLQGMCDGLECARPVGRCL